MLLKIYSGHIKGLNIEYAFVHYSEILGALPYRSDGSAPTNASNQGSISYNILSKKGIIGWQIWRRGAIGCWNCTNLGILTHFLEIFTVICNIFTNFDDFARTLWSKKQK